MKTHIDFEQATQPEAIKAKLGEGLSSLKLNVSVTPPHENNHPYHKIVHIECATGFPRDMKALAVLELDLVTEEGSQQGYTSGVGRIHVHPSFRGLNIAPILVRNSVDLFKENGDRSIECNTVKHGARFWQKMGWVPTKHGTEFGESIFDDDVSYAGWKALVHSLKRKPYEGDLAIFQKSEGSVQAALALLDENDPSSIWNFMNSQIKVSVLDYHSDEERELDFAALVLNGEKVNAVLNFDSNAQMNRFGSCVDNLVFDRQRFQEIWQAECDHHISNINFEARLYGFKPIDLSLEL